MSVSFFGQITSCAQGDRLHFDTAAFSHASKMFQNIIWGAKPTIHK